MPKKSSLSPKKASPRKAVSKRTLVEPHKGDRRYVRRKKGMFAKVVDVVKSLAADRKRPAKKTVPKGQGDRGDTKR